MNRIALASIPLSILLFLGGLVALMVNNEEMKKKGDYSIFAVSVLLLGLAALAVVSVPGLPLLKYYLCLNYDPNSDPQRPVATKGKLVTDGNPAAESEQGGRGSNGPS
jgi:hypothetical protein